MLEIKKKTLRREEWYTDEHRIWTCKYHKDEVFEGAMGLITFTGLPEPDVIDTANGKLCLADNGYQWLELVPKDGRWVVTIMFDRNHEIFQIYFDLTQRNEITALGDACFYDEFLDVVVAGGKDPEIIDQEELQEALEQGIIDQEEYDVTMRTGKKIVDTFVQHREEIMERFYAYRENF